jgi:hypothetical protein
MEIAAGVAMLSVRISAGRFPALRTSASRYTVHKPPMSESNSAVQADLFEDFADILRGELKRAGFSGISSDPDVVCRHFENYHRRRVSVQPREVHRAQPFHFPSESDFSEHELRSRVEAVAEKAEEGRDLNPHLSRNLSNVSYNDGILNDWGIHHFHLGDEIESDGFIERTGELLYARVKDEDFYMIGVYGHDSFSDKDLISVENNNWPEVIERFKLPEDIELLCSYDDDQIREARDAGVQVAIELDDGTVYIHPGGGYASTGEGADNVLAANAIKTIFSQIERQLEEEAQDLIRAANREGFDIDPPMDLQLKIDGAQAFAVEMDSNAAFFVIDMEEYPCFANFVETRKT